MLRCKISFACLISDEIMMMHIMKHNKKAELTVSAFATVQETVTSTRDCYMYFVHIPVLIFAFYPPNYLVISKIYNRN